MDLEIKNFGVEADKKLLLKAGVHKNSQIQSVFLGEEHHILCCISSPGNLKICLLSPQISKLHEFRFNDPLTQIPSEMARSGAGLNVIGKILKTTQADQDFILQIGIIIHNHLEIYKMRFSVEEGKKEFLLTNRVSVPSGVSQISLFSPRLLGLFLNQKELHMLDIHSGKLVLKKKIKGIH